MASRNEHTGDALISKSSEAYRNNYDSIFKKVYKPEIFEKSEELKTLEKEYEEKKGFYKFNKNDECYTPAYAVKPILKYIPKDAVVWCPFDKEQSEFVKEISKTHKVIFTHIENGEDFFKYEPEHYDVIISNPPFSKKAEVSKRCLELNKPFALLLTNLFLNDSGPAKLFKNELQLLMFDKRVRYIKPDGTENGSPPFGSSYFCKNFLPEKLIFETLNK